MDGAMVRTRPAFCATARSWGTVGGVGSGRGWMVPSATSSLYTLATVLSKPSKEAGTIAPASFSAWFLPWTPTSWHLSSLLQFPLEM